MPLRVMLPPVLASRLLWSISLIVVEERAALLAVMVEPVIEPELRTERLSPELRVSPALVRVKKLMLLLPETS